MQKKKPSSASSKPLKRAVKRQGSTRVGRALIAGMTQVLAHVRGEIELPSYTLVDVKAIREKMGMSQSEFARAFALNRRTVQQWEQGKAAPDVAVRAYLTVIERDPQAVVSALCG
ncbi:MAG: helix-turn-helix domain-containing protein [Bryobacteraceae bacterium]